MVGVRLLAALLISLLIGLTPVAYSDSADPLEIAGYWDDDDSDMPVDTILDACAIPTERLAGGELGSLSVVRVELPALRGPPLCCWSPCPARSPRLRFLVVNELRISHYAAPRVG